MRIVDLVHLNANATTNGPGWQRKLRRLNLFLPLSRVWNQLPLAIRQSGKRLLKSTREPRRLSREDYERIRPRFDADVRALSKLIGRDLHPFWSNSKWSEPNL